MVAERGKKSKVATAEPEEDSDHIDGELVLSIEKLQEVQDELEKPPVLSATCTLSRKCKLFTLASLFGPRSLFFSLSTRSMAANPGKKLRINEDSDEENIILAELSASIKKVWDFQDDLKKVNEEASDKVLEIEQKYNEIRRPVYVRRSEIIKTIPDFWLTAFLSHPALGDLLNEEDQKIFKYLDSLDVEDFEDVKSGYSITFNFKPNPYFEDTKLSKTFTFLDEGTTKITGTTIKWKEGMGAANGGSHEKKGNKRPPSDDSFFSWFSETQQKEIVEVEGLKDEVAEIIKEDLWPNPLKYFNNEADEEDSEGEEDDEEEKGDDDEEDDDEDGNEEDDS